MPKSRISCPICTWSTAMPMIVPKHLREKHGETRDERTTYVEFMLSGAPPLCACGCGSEPAWRNWREGFSKYVNGHNGRLSSLPAEEAARIKSARSATTRRRMESGEISPWSKGLTAVTDDRVARRNDRISEGLRRRRDSGVRCWSLGLTASTDERLARLSSSLKRSYAAGTAKPWAKGLTKETDGRVLRMSAAVSQTLLAASEQIAASRRLTWDEVAERINAAGLCLLSGQEDYQSATERSLRVLCEACGVERTTSLYQISCCPCPTCTPVSTQQEEIAAYIRSLGFECGSDRVAIAPKEIDVLVPIAGVGVEHHGLYWHTEGRVGKRMHTQKWESCNAAGIKLLQVFGDEWRDRRDVVKSMIASRLGRSSRKIGARTCSLERMSSPDRKAFFNQSHLEGDVKAAAAWCLRHNGEIVAAISVRRPKIRSRKEELEIARFACTLNTTVSGGLSRLMRPALDYARQAGARSLMTYVDTRIGDGHGYASCGMQLVGKTSPRFWWTDMNRRYDRFRHRANKSAGLTEAAVAKRAGVEKIWGCPNLIYSLSIS